MKLITFEFYAPITEYSHDFIQGMLNRMGVSFTKYGAIKDGYPNKVNAVKSLELRLKKYRETGNTEYLMDVANFAMIEFKYPAHKKAYFKAEDSNKSPGRYFHDNYSPTTKSNKEE